MTTPIDRLTTMGFKNCGGWKFEAEVLRYVISENSTSKNVLYAFVSAGTVLYIGKTVQSLQRRMYGYQNPGPTQSYPYS